jgi:hypothetical protein
LEQPGLSTPLRLWRPARTVNNCGVLRRCMPKPVSSSVRDGGLKRGDFGMLRCGGMLIPGRVWRHAV